jgi:hypothetical protein
MQHALGRALKAQTARDLSNLDKERLNALARFFHSELSLKPAADVFSFAGFGGQSSSEPTYSLDFDLLQMIKNLPEFDGWHAAQKLGFEKKWQKLVSALELYSTSLNGSLLPNQPPREEFQILQRIISELLLHTESGLESNWRTEKLSHMVSCFGVRSQRANGNPAHYGCAGDYRTLRCNRRAGGTPERAWRSGNGKRVPV